MNPAAAAVGHGPAPGATSGPDMTSISFRDQLWLNSFPLDRGLVFDYFALSPFYDQTCSNEQLRMRSIHPLDAGQLKYVSYPCETVSFSAGCHLRAWSLSRFTWRTMTGVEYVLHEAQEPHLFVIWKQKRDGPERVNILSAYYVLDGSIYQAPQLYSVISSRAVRALYHITEAFSQAALKLEKFGHDTESATTNSEDAVVAEAAQKKVDKTVDKKEAIRIDQILAGVFRRLPAAPPPPPFAFAPPPAETGQLQSGQQQPSAEGEGAGTVSSELGKANKRLKIEKQ